MNEIAYTIFADLVYDRKYTLIDDILLDHSTGILKAAELPMLRVLLSLAEPIRTQLKSYETAHQKYLEAGFWYGFHATELQLINLEQK